MEDADLTQTRFKNCKVQRDVRHKGADAFGEVQAVRSTQRWLGIRRERKQQRLRERKEQRSEGSMQQGQGEINSQKRATVPARAHGTWITVRDMESLEIDITGNRPQWNSSWINGCMRLECPRAPW